MTAGAFRCCFSWKNARPFLRLYASVALLRVSRKLSKQSCPRRCISELFPLATPRPTCSFQLGRTAVTSHPLRSTNRKPIQAQFHGRLLSSTSMPQRLRVPGRLPPIIGKPQRLPVLGRLLSSTSNPQRLPARGRPLSSTNNPQRLLRGGLLSRSGPPSGRWVLRARGRVRPRRLPSSA